MCLTFLLVVVSVWSTTLAGKMDVLYQWTSMDYQFPSPQSKYSFVKSGAFVPGNSIALDVDTSPLDPQGRVFLTTPRFQFGVPASLSVVNKQSGLLEPYPDWSWHKPGDCQGITSVLRVKIDRCGQMWVLDSGVIDVFTTRKRNLCPAQILVFNVTNDELLWRYQIPNVPERTLLGTVEVDMGGSCKDVFLYLADIQAFNMRVVDAPRARSWVVNNNYMYPSPPEGHFDLNSVQFDLMDGIISVALAPDRKLYFHSLSSRRESWVSTAVLKNSENFKDGASPYEPFTVSPGQRGGQSGPSAFDSSGSALFFSVLPTNSLNCWNPATAYTPQNIVEVFRDDVTFQFLTGIKVVRDAAGREWVWAVTTRLQNAMVGKTDSKAVNYRVLRGLVSDLVRGTPCG